MFHSCTVISGSFPGNLKRHLALVCQLENFFLFLLTSKYKINLMFWAKPKIRNCQRKWGDDLGCCVLCCPCELILWVYFIISAPCCFEAELNNLQWMQMSLNILIPEFTNKLKVRFTASRQQMEQYFSAHRKK